MILHNPTLFAALETKDSRQSKAAHRSLTDAEWCNLHDALALAMDALGSAPEEVDAGNLKDCTSNLVHAYKIALGK